MHFVLHFLFTLAFLLMKQSDSLYFMLKTMQYALEIEWKNQQKRTAESKNTLSFCNIFPQEKNKGRQTEIK